jgi:pyridoxal phosphate-dependent aminotransferase EpsN
MIAVAVNKTRICLSPPHMSGYEQAYIADAFATNWIAPLGPHVDGFEKEIAEYVGISGAAALSSGTAAIHLALKCAGVRRGDVVFCSSLTFSASANPIVYEGATPVFIDSEPESWNMSAEALHRAFIDADRSGKLPKAVIVVNLYGQSADMDRLLEICSSFGVPVIEDAAESLGATYKGKASGTLGKFGMYSFNGNKIITTSGGGMMVSDDLESVNKARFWATQARDPARHYQHSEIGYNYRLSNIAAAIGRGQLCVLGERIKKRRQIFARYFKELSPIAGIEFMPEAPYGLSNRWLTTLTIDPGVAKFTVEELMDALEADAIESRPVWKPLHLQPVFKDCQYYPHKVNKSISDRLFEQGICLPSGSSMTPEDQDRVIKNITDCVTRNTRLVVGLS